MTDCFCGVWFDNFPNIYAKNNYIVTKITKIMTSSTGGN